MSSKEVELANLCVKIDCYLRALNTLGVTTDKCTAMLHPLVESSLPEKLLCVWQRTNSENRKREMLQSKKHDVTRETRDCEEKTCMF